MPAMATGIKMGWRKAMRFAATQIAEPAITIRRTTNTLESAAHMILRCQGVGYLFIATANKELSSNLAG